MEAMNPDEPEPAAARPSTPAPGRAVLGRVLLVDDDQTMCEAMELTLGRRGLEITWRTSALDAIELIAERDFDVILTDLTMPMMDGLELCARALAIRPKAAIVVVTGHNSVAAAHAAIRAGAYDFLLKPVDGKLLERMVARALEHRRLRD